MPDNALDPSLRVYLRQDLIGRLWLDERGRFAFQYEPAWLNRGDSIPLSLSLPLRAEAYLDDGARPFFSNLLPEAGIRQTLARRERLGERILSFRVFRLSRFRGEIPALERSSKEPLLG